MHVVESSERDIVSRFVISPTHDQKLFQSSEYKVHGPDVGAIGRFVVHSLRCGVQVPLILFVQQGQSVLDEESMADIWSGDGVVTDGIVVPSGLFHDESLVVCCVRYRAETSREGSEAVDLCLVQALHCQQEFGLVVDYPVALGVIGEPGPVESMMSPLGVLLICEEMAGLESRRRWRRIDSFANVGESPIGDWGTGVKSSVMGLETKKTTTYPAEIFTPLSISCASQTTLWPLLPESGPVKNNGSSR